MPWLTARRQRRARAALRGVPAASGAKGASPCSIPCNLDGCRGEAPARASGGMRQRVALARALAQDRPVLLMDEPFAALDAITRDLLHEELERVWRATGRTIVFVTHNVREAARLGQRVVLLSSRPGRIVQEWRIAQDHRTAHRVARGRGAVGGDHRPAAEGDPPQCRVTPTRS